MIGHILLALAIMGIIRRVSRSWIGGAAAASAWAIAREITQAEYRWIESYGAGRRANMPWWGGLDLSVWQHLDPWLDWIVPTFVVIVLAVLLDRRSRNQR